MPRAKQICSTARCLKPVTFRGKCEIHAPPSWDGWTRRHDLPSNWTTLRLRILRRDKWTCYVCGNDANEVDHIERGSNHDPSNLAAICSRCHKAKTARESQEARRRK
ncbi:HNH endonuclease [Nonomuraea roseola]|uniref:HNH endonuclease signature motif containing protein n=1 Tax=Nonomuraea roseola TaxID=46179 RepID=A0ABV5Q0K4_9ACTN